MIDLKNLPLGKNVHVLELLSIDNFYATVENFTQLFVDGRVLLAQKYWRDFFNTVDEHKNIPR